MASDDSLSKEVFRNVWYHNWDDGIESLKPLLESPGCDKASALAAYWLGSPGFYNQFKDESEMSPRQLETFTFLKSLEERVKSGEFPEALSFAPPADRIPENLGRIPEWMLVSSHGEADALASLEGEEAEQKFFAALCDGDLEKVRFYVESVGLDPNAPLLFQGYWSLVISCQKGHLEQFEYLLERGAHWDRDFDDENLFVHAVKQVDGQKVFPKLKELGVDINGIDDYERTPLHLSVEFYTQEQWQNEREPITKALLELGADPTIEDEDGRTPVDAALAKENKAAAELMRRYVSNFP